MESEVQLEKNSDAEEEIGDSWEEIDEEELERRVQSRQKKLANEELKSGYRSTPVVSSAYGSQGTSFSPVEGPCKIKHSEGSEYVPQVKILKRPDTQSSQDRSQVQLSTKKPVKSLAEREAEYADARARILGSEYGSQRSLSQAKGTHRTQQNKN